MYKKFIYETVLFSVITLMLFIALTVLSYKTDPPFGSHLKRLDIIKARGHEFEAITIGNSAGCAIDFQELKIKGYHLWIGGQDMFETAASVESLLPYLPNLKQVFIPIALFNFQQDNGVQSSFNSIRRQFYYLNAVFHPLDVIKRDFKNLALSKLTPLVRKDHWEGVFDYIFYKISKSAGLNYSIPEDPKKYLNDDGIIGPKYTSYLKRDTLFNRAQKHITLTGRMRKLNTKVTSQIYSAMNDMIETLRSKNINVVFYTPPYSDIYFNALNEQVPEVITEMRNLMKDLSGQQGVYYFDFSTDSTYTSKDEIFFNENHLNANGAKIFSSNLRQILFSKGIISQ